MQTRNTDGNQPRKALPVFRPVLLFVFAASLLGLMSIIVEPGLVLPLAAFLLMAGLTHQLGLKLYQDLTATAYDRRSGDPIPTV
ncbi:MAG: hypothetical protein ABJN98_19995 [Roseibium sp.]